MLGGDVEAFRAIVERHQATVLAVVRNLLSDAQDGEDVAQETFLAAYRGLATFDPTRGRFAAWLLRIARNLALNAIRRRRPRPLVDVSPDAFPAPPGRAVEAAEAARTLDRALRDLPVEQRATFVLVEIHGLTYEETADIEGVGIGTVKSRLSRARARLRGILGCREEVRR